MALGEDDDSSRNSTRGTTKSGERHDGLEEGRLQGRKKYSAALQTLLPYRKESPKRQRELPSSHAGLFSFVSYAWLTPIMWKAFRHGLTPADLWELHEADKAEGNAKRLSRIWEEEKALVGEENAKFMKAIWKFGRTRFYVCILLMITSVIFQFLGPAWILKSVLAYHEDLTQPVQVGISLAVMAFLAQLMRNITFATVWIIGIHTGMRVEGAMQYMTYEKMLRLRNGGENILSKSITFCTNDQERIFECVSGGVLAFAAPAMFLLCLIYSCIVIGPWALVGNLVIFLFYPIMGGVARFIGQIRRKAVKHTNKRVGLMTEIMNSIRLIKIQGWEDSFSDKVKKIRATEEVQLRKAAFLQSFTATLTPMVSLVAAISVFLGYTLCGNNLTASETFTIFAVFNAMQFTIGTLPFAVRSIAEASVCFTNFQKFLDLPEYKSVVDPNLPCDHDAVVAIQNGNFAWEVEKPASEPAPQANKRKRPKSKKNMKKSLENVATVTENEEGKPNGNGTAASGGSGDATKAEQEALTAELERNKEDRIVLEDCLKAITIQIKRGSLMGVSGAVGSGKSSLLSAILGDMVKTEGGILIRGSLAVVSQQAWIYSDSLQENILFGSPMNKEKYDTVLDICCLRPDILALGNGDLTIIGERGVNLSGGQKARVNFARAIYADKSIYLLDDPLAPIDSVVGKQIFEKCIKQHLKDKTVILVTNAVQFLEECDDIIFLKEGEIVEHGSHAELLVQKQHYYNVLQYHNQNQNHREDPQEETLPLLSSPGHLDEQMASAPTPNVSNSPLKRRNSSKKEEVVAKSFQEKISEDDSQYKYSGFLSYALYIKACGGILVFLLLMLFFIGFGMTKVFSSIWIRNWIDAGDGNVEERGRNFTSLNITVSSDEELKGYIGDNPNLGYYQGILASTIALCLLVGLIKGFLSTRFIVTGASSLHQQMLFRILHAPMSFLDVTPVGKITNRFSKDMDELDSRLPFFFEFVIQSVIFVLLSLLVISVIYPAFSVGLLIIIGVMIFFDIWLNMGVRETKKLETVLKTPVVHHLQSSLSGLSIIRTFHRQDQFKSRFSSYVNNHLAAESVYRSANRWFTFRIEAIGLITIFATVLLTVLTRESGTVTPALVGLALSSLYSVCTFVPFVMRMKSELQSRFISVERILEYSEGLEEEEPASKVVIKPSDNWPQRGAVKFTAVSMRYQPELPLVLKHVSFEIQSAEKIGVVGRTGAGKTSIISALLRLYEIEEGMIAIDAQDVNEISLKCLRSAIAVIPQDPVLFHGTLRYNLDPFDEHSDDDLWLALEKSHVKPKIEKEERKLLMQVSTDGENFSVGEKQLICLARALLRKNKILLLDEATSSLDIETDFLIQQTIRDAFEACTVITIAHRLNTVAHYNRILVMDHGQVIELDTPSKLMDDEDSLFHKMMAASGISSLDQLLSRRQHTSSALE